MNAIHRRRLTLAPVIAVGAALALAGCARDSNHVVAIEAPKIEGVTYIDEGDPGAGPGDRRVFESNGTDDSGQPVRSDWELTTISVSDTMEVRMARASFVFEDGSQLLLGGSADYPVGGGTLDRDVVVERPVTGGSGRFAGARGFVRTTHRANDTWRWEFHLYP